MNEMVFLSDWTYEMIKASVHTQHLRLVEYWGILFWLIAAWIIWVLLLYQQSIHISFGNNLCKFKIFMVALKNAMLDGCSLTIKLLFFLIIDQWLTFILTFWYDNNRFTYKSQLMVFLSNHMVQQYSFLDKGRVNYSCSFPLIRNLEMATSSSSSHRNEKFWVTSIILNGI